MSTTSKLIAFGFWPNKPPPASKRVIINHLSKEKVNVKEIIDLIEADKVPEDWLITMAV